MIAILEFIFLLLMLPFIMGRFIVAHLYNTINDVFEFTTFVTGIWGMWCGMWLIYFMTPDDEPFQTIVQIIATSSVFDVPTPYLLLGIGSALIPVALLIRLKYPARPMSYF